MRQGICLLTAAALCVLITQRVSSVAADHPVPACEPGYKIVQEICYKDVIKKTCKVVPDVKKVEKWVYDCKSVDFCLPKCSLNGSHGRACGQCAGCLECGSPMSKSVLIKRKVVEEVKTEKCIVESVVERVAYTVWRKVKCDATASPAASPPAPLPSADKSR